MVTSPLSCPSLCLVRPHHCPGGRSSQETADGALLRLLAVGETGRRQWPGGGGRRPAVISGFSFLKCCCLHLAYRLGLFSPGNVRTSRVHRWWVPVRVQREGSQACGCGRGSVPTPPLPTVHPEPPGSDPPRPSAQNQVQLCRMPLLTKDLFRVGTVPPTRLWALREQDLSWSFPQPPSSPEEAPACKSSWRCWAEQVRVRALQPWAEAVQRLSPSRVDLWGPSGWPPRPCKPSGQPVCQRDAVPTRLRRPGDPFWSWERSSLCPRRLPQCPNTKTVLGTVVQWTWELALAVGFQPLVEQLRAQALCGGRP